MHKDTVNKVTKDLINYMGDSCEVDEIWSMGYERLYGYLKQLEIELPNSFFIEKAIERMDNIRKRHNIQFIEQVMKEKYGKD